MSRIVTSTKPLVLCWVPLSTLFRDTFDFNKDKDNASKTSEEETGWDRVKKIFESDKVTGTSSKELLLITSYTYGGLIAGAFFGGIVNTRTAAQDFIDRNAASRFMSNLDARRRMRDYVMIRCAKGVKEWCPKFTIFAVLYGTSTVCLNAYSGKSTITNYLLGGMITGGLCKINLGIPGVVAGAALGGLLSGVLGSISLLIMRITGHSMEELLVFNKQHFDYKKQVNIQNEETIKEEPTNETNVQTSDTKEL